MVQLPRGLFDPSLSYVPIVGICYKSSSSYPFPTLSGVGTMVIKMRQLFLRPAACLTSTLLVTGADANDCKCRGICYKWFLIKIVTLEW
jgi:hypothetical protein